MGIWSAAVTKSKTDAAAEVFDALSALAHPPSWISDLTESNCADITPNCYAFEFLITFSNGTQAVMSYDVFSVQNVLGETGFLASPNTYTSDPNSFDARAETLGVAGILSLDAATKTPITSTLTSVLTGAQSPASVLKSARIRVARSTATVTGAARLTAPRSPLGSR